jgi:hypothetical protein
MEIAPNYKERWQRFNDYFMEILETYLPFHHRSLIGLEGDLAAMPNILMYGVYGFPLDMLWKQALMRRFQIHKFSSTSCSWGKEIEYMENPYYIHIDLENPAVTKDVEVLQEFLKIIITTRNIVCDRHIIILENIDSLITKNSSMNAFRVLLERFSKNVWFICTTYHNSKLEPPIRSRFFSIRIPLPTEEDVSKIIMYLDGGKERIELQTRNLLLAITMPNYENEQFRWMACTTFPPVCDYILNTTNPTIEGIRTIIHRAFQCGVTIAQLAYSIIETCIRRGDSEENIHKIVSEFAKYEHMSSQSKGTRTLLYMEYMLHFVMFMLPIKRKIRIE